MTLRPVLIRVPVGLVCIGLLILALRSGGWSRAAQAALHVSPTALALALAATVVSMVISGVIWARVLWCLGHPVPVTVGLTVYAATGLAAYLGAGAGALGQCLWLLHRRGVCAGRAAMLLAIATMIGFCGSMLWAPCGAALLAAPAALHALPALGSHARLIAVIAMAVCAAGTLSLLWLITLMPRLGPRWRIPRFAADPSAPLLRLNLHRLLALIPLAGLAWLVGAGSLWFLVHAAAPRAAVTLPTAIAVQSLASVIGGMAFFLPNGLGARDGAIVALLVGIAGVPLPAAAAVAGLARASDPAGKALVLLGTTTLGLFASRGPRRTASQPPIGALWRDTTAA